MDFVSMERAGRIIKFSTYTDVIDQDVKAFSFQLFFHFGCSAPNASGFDNLAFDVDDLFARSINDST